MYVCTLTTSSKKKYNLTSVCNTKKFEEKLEIELQSRPQLIWLMAVQCILLQIPLSVHYMLYSLKKQKSKKILPFHSSYLLMLLLHPAHTNHSIFLYCTICNIQKYGKLNILNKVSARTKQ